MAKIIGIVIELGGRELTLTMDEFVRARNLFNLHITTIGGNPALHLNTDKQTYPVLRDAQSSSSS